MAGLKWIRIETTMLENLKFLHLKEDKQHRLIVVHLDGMCYAGRQGLNGFIPKSAMRVIGATTADANRLVSAGLWTPAPGGWTVNGWDEYQVSDEDAVKRSEKAQKAAAARWEKARNGAEHADA